MIEQKDIKFSIHAKRRMKLYGISEEDVLNVLRNGRKETSGDGKIFFLHDINKKFKYPVKVITFQGDKERGRNNFPNYASQLQATFARSQITKILK